MDVLAINIFPLQSKGLAVYTWLAWTMHGVTVLTEYHSGLMVFTDSIMVSDMEAGKKNPTCWHKHFFLSFTKISEYGETLSM